MNGFGCDCKTCVTRSWLAIATKCWITVGARGIMIESLKTFSPLFPFFHRLVGLTCTVPWSNKTYYFYTLFCYSPTQKTHSAEWWCYFSCQIYHPYWPTVAVTTMIFISKTICFFCTDRQLKKYNTKVFGVKHCGQNIG